MRDHLAHGVPDLRVAKLPARYEDLRQHDLPLERDEIGRLRAFAPRFTELCNELAADGLPETIQHDDLHHANVYAQGERRRVLDWGDSSISHPLASLVVTFRFLEEINKLPPGDPWFARLRDAYLEPWGRGLAGAFALANRVGTFAHTFASMRQRDRRTRAPNTTKTSQSCCDGRSLRHSNRPSDRALNHAGVLSASPPGRFSL